MRPVAELKSNDPNVVYCVGDNISILKFEIGNMSWLRIPVDNDKRT